MKKVLLIFVLLLTVGAVSVSAQVFRKSVQRNVFDQKIFDLCKEVGSTMDKKDSTKIAISEFYTLDGPRSPYSRFLNEAITIELFKIKKFKILEKGRLEKVLKEQKMELNGREDGEVAKKVGKLLDVKAIMAGTIIEMQNTLKVNARLIDAGTGIIIAASTIEIDKKMVIPSYGEQLENVENSQNNLPQNLPTEEPIVNLGNCFAQLKDARIDRTSVVFEVSFINTKVDEELDFINAILPGYSTELVGNTKKYQIESISYLKGANVIYSGKVMLRKNQPEVVTFKFLNAGKDFPNFKYFTILAKGSSFPQTAVLKINLAE